MKKVVGTNQEMAFRASLIRSTLELDSIPNHETVKTFSEHLLGEMEQMVHLEKKTKQRALSPPQVRQVEVEKPTVPVGLHADRPQGAAGHGAHHGGGAGGPSPGGQERQKPLCKFFLS